MSIRDFEPAAAEEIDRKLAQIAENPDVYDAALNLFCYCVRGQFFLDGNKRTATLAANLYLIGRGAGIFSIPTEVKEEFYQNPMLPMQAFANSSTFKGAASTPKITPSGTKYVYAGTSVTIKPSGTYKKVAYKSSNTKAATVSKKGVVKAVKRVQQGHGNFYTEE